jgi:hypothetical protein
MLSCTVIVPVDLDASDGITGGGSGREVVLLVESVLVLDMLVSVVLVVIAPTGFEGMADNGVRGFL